MIKISKATYFWFKRKLFTCIATPLSLVIFRIETMSLKIEYSLIRDPMNN